jgi:hypothetical protein
MGKGIGVALPHANRWIRADSMQIRILCDTHNSLLSETDAEAGRLVTALRRYHATPPGALRDGAPQFETISIDGNKLERWALKTFLNHATWSACMPAETPSWNRPEAVGFGAGRDDLAAENFTRLLLQFRWQREDAKVA